MNKEEVRGVAGYRKEQPISSVLFSCKNADHARGSCRAPCYIQGSVPDPDYASKS